MLNQMGSIMHEAKSKACNAEKSTSTDFHMHFDAPTGEIDTYLAALVGNAFAASAAVDDADLSASFRASALVSASLCSSWEGVEADSSTGCSEANADLPGSGSAGHASAVNAHSNLTCALSWTDGRDNKAHCFRLSGSSCQFQTCHTCSPITGQSTGGSHTTMVVAQSKNSSNIRKSVHLLN